MAAFADVQAKADIERAWSRFRFNECEHLRSRQKAFPSCQALLRRSIAGLGVAPQGRVGALEAVDSDLACLVSRQGRMDEGTPRGRA
jgi:hypothetical protein